MNRVATREEAKIIAGDVPSRAKLIQYAIWCETSADQLAQSLLDCIVLCLEAGDDRIIRSVLPTP
jgi:hypothetical protein